MLRRDVTLVRLDRCNFCEGGNLVPCTQVDSWTIDRCRDCGLRCTNPRPDAGSIVRLYSEDYFRHNERFNDYYYTPEGAPRLPASSDYRNRIEDIESRVPRRGRLLEIGAAMGGFVAIMRARGWDAAGIELSHDAVEGARQTVGVELFEGPLENFLPADPFDVITMYQTLEHVPDPAYVIDRCFELLNPGGLLLVEVPHIRSFEMLISRDRRRLTYDLPHHLFHFVPSVLEGRLRAAGFERVQSENYYPAFLIELDSFLRRSRARRTTAGAARDDESGVLDSPGDLPMMRRPSGWKLGLVRGVARVFPGWRFTTTGRRPQERLTDE